MLAPIVSFLYKHNKKQHTLNLYRLVLNEHQEGKYIPIVYYLSSPIYGIIDVY